MQRSLGLCIAVAALSAAPQTGSSPADKQDLYRELDLIRTAIRGNDWDEALRRSILLRGSLARYASNRISPDLELSHLELMAGKDAISRTPLLARMAKTAYAAGDLAKAERYAMEALEAAKHGVFPWTGDAIHQGSIVLGRLALRRGDMESARKYLLDAGKTPGSATLAVSGPNMTLARELLDRDEFTTVARYLEECAAFWTQNRGKLPEWTALVKAGLKPDFGANLD